MTSETRADGYAAEPDFAASFAIGEARTMFAGDVTIFVIDDDEAVRDALATSLEAAGHKVALFASARQFLDWYEPGQPGCVVVDLDLRGMGGAALLHVLSARNARLPAVITSARLRNPGPIDGLPAGAVEILPKPFGDEELLERVRHALRSREASAASDHSGERP